MTNEVTEINKKKVNFEIDKYKLKEMIKMLRALKTEEFLLRNTRRVNAFKFIDALVALNKKYSPVEIKELFMFLMDEGIVFKVEKTAEGVVDTSMKRNLTSQDLFIWDKEDNSFIHKILFMFCLAGLGCVGMFKIFPRWHRYLIYYLRYPILAFFAFMFASAIVRTTIYLITLFCCEEQLWIWPNLFADCGFFDSFRPAYQWTENTQKEE